MQSRKENGVKLGACIHWHSLKQSIRGRLKKTRMTSGEWYWIRT